MNLLMVMFGLLLAMGLTLDGCESKKEVGEGTEGVKKSETAKKSEEVIRMENIVLPAPDTSPGKSENGEGINHFKQGHFDVAQKHFRTATETDPNLAVAHYNLALSLDKLENHSEATEHFKKSLELAPDNPAIRDSAILKAHIGALGKMTRKNS